MLSLSEGETMKRVVFSIVVAVLLLAACSSESSRRKAELAAWHVEWRFAFSLDKQGTLLGKLAEMEPPWESGPERLRFDRYVTAHQLAYHVKATRDELQRGITNTLEPYQAGSFFSCSPAAWMDGAVSIGEEGWQILAAAGFEEEDIWRTCAIDNLTGELLISLEYEAEYGWLENEIGSARKRVRGEREAAATATGNEPEVEWGESERLLGDIGLAETSIRCPSCDTLQVYEVVDGGTLATAEGVVTLYGLDPPAKGERCFGTAADTLSQWIEWDVDGETWSGTVRVESGPQATDEFGRRSYYVYTEAGNSIDEILVRTGVVQASTRDGQHLDRLLELEAEAPQDKEACFWR